MQRTGNDTAGLATSRAIFNQSLESVREQIALFERQNGSYKSALERRDHLLSKENELCNGGIMRKEREIKLELLRRPTNPWEGWRCASEAERFKIEKGLAPIIEAAANAEAALRSWMAAFSSKGKLGQGHTALVDASRALVQIAPTPSRMALAEEIKDMDQTQDRL